MAEFNQSEFEEWLVWDYFTKNPFVGSRTLEELKNIYLKTKNPS